ncbi:MAG: hypothetical protein ABSH47_20500 [Bryobacteraceae bacterium]|jgi:hypothetical protein
MPYLAAVEVDQRQHIIGSTDKLKEMLGASWHIGATVPGALDALQDAAHTRIVMPVSGALWLTSTSLPELAGILAQIRAQVVEELNLPSTFAIVEYTDDFNQGRKELEKRVRALKDAKTGEDHEALPPLAANCQMLPSRAANHWFPGRLNPQQERRALVSEAAEQRFARGQSTLTNYTRHLDPLLRGFKTPWKLDHLTEGVADQYLALVKADADGMNRILASIDWSDLGDRLAWTPETWEEVRNRARWPYGEAKPDRVSPEQALTWFSFSLDDSIWRALKIAISTLADEERRCRAYFPIAPIVRAGEDTALFCRRDLALPLVARFGHAFEQIVKNHPVLRHFTGNDALSLSFGILYAKQGYPFQMMWELADELQSSAKEGRAAANSTTGFVDLQWFASSGRVGITALRKESLTYQAGGTEYRLTTRPWTLSRAGQMLAAAEELARSVSPSRWVELETALWAGGSLTDLAYQRWLLQLERGTRELVFRHMTEWSSRTERYPRLTPWFTAIIRGQTVQCCGLLDLAELVRTFRRME